MGIGRNSYHSLFGYRRCFLACQATAPALVIDAKVCFHADLSIALVPCEKSQDLGHVGLLTSHGEKRVPVMSAEWRGKFTLRHRHRLNPTNMDTSKRKTECSCLSDGSHCDVSSSRPSCNSPCGLLGSKHLLSNVVIVSHPQIRNQGSL